MTSSRARVAVIGGGVIGTSILFHLTDRGCSDVVLFDKGQLGSGSTSKAAGGVRHVFANPFNIEVGKKNIAYFERFEENVGREIEFRQTGYQYLYHTDEEEAMWRERKELYDEHDMDTRLLSPSETAEVFEGLREEEIAGSLYAPECGHVDPHEVTQAYAGAAADNGAEIHTKTAVEDVTVDDDGVTSVVTEAGEWEVDHVVNAAGPWARDLAATVGVDVPIELMGRRIAVTSPLDIGESPLLIDNQRNVYFRTEANGSMLICDMDPDVHDIERPEEFQAGDIGYDYYLGALEKVDSLVHGVEDLEVINGWAGIQSHTPDKSPILGDSGVEGFWLACGFSGHGVQKSPTVGGSLADAILTGETDVLDLDHFRLDRFDGHVDVEGEAMNM